MEQTTNLETQNLDQNLNPVTPSKNIFKILFFILLALVLVISSVLTTLLITKIKTPVSNQITPVPISTIVDETSDWKTYTSKNEYIDYNFIYPKTWKLLERSNNTIQIAGDIDSDYDNKVANGVRVCGNYTIVCYKNLGIYVSGPGTYYNQPNTINNYVYSEKQQFNEVQKTTINNQTAYSFYAAGMAPEIKKYFIERGDGAFCEISFCDKDLTTNENHFLNSFKFEDLASVQDWQTYTNDTYKYSLKYPSDSLILNKNSDEFIYFSGKNIPKDINPIAITPGLQVNVYKNTSFLENNDKNLNLEEWIKEQQKKGLISSYKAINFQSLPAFEVVEKGYSDVQGIYISKNNYIYSISVLAEKISELDQSIINTFKFN